MYFSFLETARNFHLTHPLLPRGTSRGFCKGCTAPICTVSSSGQNQWLRHTLFPRPEAKIDPRILKLVQGTNHNHSSICVNINLRKTTNMKIFMWKKIVLCKQNIQCDWCEARGKKTRYIRSKWPNSIPAGVYSHIKEKGFCLVPFGG